MQVTLKVLRYMIRSGSRLSWENLNENEPEHYAIKVARRVILTLAKALMFAVGSTSGVRAGAGPIQPPARSARRQSQGNSGTRSYSPGSNCSRRLTRKSRATIRPAKRMFDNLDYEGGQNQNWKSRSKMDVANKKVRNLVVRRCATSLAIARRALNQAMPERRGIPQGSGPSRA